MEIQCPFQISFEALPQGATFADYLLAKVAKHGKAVAMVDSETKAQWRFCDIETSVQAAVRAFKEAGIDKTCKMAFSAENSPGVLVLMLAGARLGISVTGINPFGTVDELWHMVWPTSAENSPGVLVLMLAGARLGISVTGINPFGTVDELWHMVWPTSAENSPGVLVLMLAGARLGISVTGINPFGTVDELWHMVWPTSAENSPGVLVLMLAGARLGISVTGINPFGTVDELWHMVWPTSAENSPGVLVLMLAGARLGISVTGINPFGTVDELWHMVWPTSAENSPGVLVLMLAGARLGISVTGINPFGTVDELWHMVWPTSAENSPGVLVLMLAGARLGISVTGINPFGTVDELWHMVWPTSAENSPGVLVLMLAGARLGISVTGINPFGTVDELWHMVWPTSAENSPGVLVLMLAGARLGISVTGINPFGTVDELWHMVWPTSAENSPGVLVLMLAGARLGISVTGINPFGTVDELWHMVWPTSAENSPGVLVLMLAGARLGISVTGINPFGTVDELWHMVWPTSAENSPGVLVLMLAGARLGISVTGINPFGTVDELWHMVWPTSAENSPGVLVLMLAGARLGISVTGINPFGTVDELWHMVDLCEASHVLTQLPFVPKFEEVRKKAAARGSLAKIRHIWLLEDYLAEPVAKSDGPKGSAATIARLTGGSGGGAPPPAGRRVSKAVNSAKPPPKSSRVNSNQVSPAGSVVSVLDEEPPADAKVVPGKGESASNHFLLFFSAGTTGLPKPIELSHASFVVQMQQLSAPYLRPPKRNERVLASVPLYHVYGATTAFLALLQGASLITLPTYDHPALLGAIAEYKAQALFLTPYNVLGLAEEALVEEAELSSVQTLTCAGAPLDPLVGQTAAERLNLKDLRQLYGATETLALSWPSFGCTKIDSVGVPLPGVTVKVMSLEKKSQAPAGELGELCVKGPQIITSGPTQGPRYYKNPKATGELVDKEGWVRTGDLGYYDSEGYLYIVDRVKDMIRHKGMQASPTEIEILLRTHPGVADCAVIGRPEAIAGDVPAAFVVKGQDHVHIQPSDIRDHVKGKISGFKELKGGIFFVSEIPRSASGKVLRRSLKSFWERDRQKDKKDPPAKGGKAAKK